MSPVRNRLTLKMLSALWPFSTLSPTQSHEESFPTALPSSPHKPGPSCHLVQNPELPQYSFPSMAELWDTSQHTQSGLQYTYLQASAGTRRVFPTVLNFHTQPKHLQPLKQITERCRTELKSMNSGPGMPESKSWFRHQLCNPRQLFSLSASVFLKW